MEISVSKEESDFMYGFVKKIVKEIGPRMPCSPQEAKAAQIIKDEFKKTCDDAIIESFSCHPKAFLGWIKVDVMMVCTSMILYLVLQLFSDYIISLLIGIIIFSLAFLPLLILWEEFFNYKEFIDPFFRKKYSQNTIGIFKPDGEIKKIIIFSSHADSAIEFKLQKILGYGFIPLAFGGIFIMLIWFALSFIILIILILNIVVLKGIFFGTVIWLLFIGTPCFIGLFFFVPLGDKGNVVPGSVDNLSSCAVIQGLGRYLNTHRENIPEHTEIRLISFGCEESGLRGAFRYVEKHGNELKKKDALVFNMDGLETPDKFHAIEFEPTTRTWHSQEVIQRIIDAAESVGVTVPRLGAGKLEKTLGRLSGGSDAAAFSKAGIKAGFLNSADWKTRSNYYHQSEDTPDKIKPGTLETALKICIAFLINQAD